MTFEKWVSQNLGKSIDYDGVYGVQCVDLAKHYIKNVLGVKPESIGNAIEYYNKRKTSEYLTKNFKWIDNTAEFVPKKGDLCVHQEAETVTFPLQRAREQPRIFILTTKIFQEQSTNR